MSVKFRIYAGTLSFELRHNLDQGNSLGRVGGKATKVLSMGSGMLRTGNWTSHVIQKEV